jgi:membrane-bound metal-dependent hydrolase YbcI (DUF457 family)
MPTPMGHALGGLAAAFLTDSTAARSRLTPALLGAAAVVATLPDLDLLVGSHRTYTHSVGAMLLIGLVSWLIFRARSTRAARAAIIVMAAYGSHLLLDWTGTDTSNPPGLMIAWPLSSAFYISGLNVFGQVSRRYWLPQEFIAGNMVSFAREMAVIVPMLFIAWTLWSTRTLTLDNENRKRKNE